MGYETFPAKETHQPSSTALIASAGVPPKQWNTPVRSEASAAMISAFIRDPEFVGQTKDRLATVEAARLVEASVRDRIDTWLAGDPKTSGAILDYLVLRAEERLKRRQEKETARKSAT